MTGFVNTDREAVIPLMVRGPHGATRIIDTVLDTGFTGQLTIPSILIRDLRLPFDSQSPATLADGSEVVVDIYVAYVDWDGMEVKVLAVAAEGGALLGMSLLYGSNGSLDVIDGGVVRTARL